MRRVLFLAPMLVWLAGSTSKAQDSIKVAATFECGEPDQSYTIEIGDHPGHEFMLTKTACRYTKPLLLGGTQSKTHLTTLFNDLGDHTMRHAVAAIKFENGDELFYRSEGTGVAPGGVPQTANGQWFIDGGTGKFEGAKGQGTYEGRTPPEGTRTYNLEGEITLAK